MNSIISSQSETDLKILFIGPYPPPFGGISSLIKSLIEGLKEKNIQEAFVLYYGASNKTTKVDGALVYERSVRKNIWQLFNPINWLLLPSLLRAYSGYGLSLKDYLEIYIKTIIANNLVNKHKINTTNFYKSEASPHLILCKKLWSAKTSVILTVFGEIYDAEGWGTTKKELLLQILHESDAIISSSCHCANSFDSIGNTRDIEVIFIGVSLSRFSEGHLLRKKYREELAIKDDVVVLLFMGRFLREMGLHAIIDMVPSLMKGDIKFRIILAGAIGDLVPSSLECQSLYPDNITVMNNIPFDLQPALYAASDIVLAPSRDKHACMGVAIKEAMAASVPVIASNSGGIPEAVVHEGTGIIVPLKEDGENDLEKFTEAIFSLSKDINKRSFFAENARKRAIDIFSEEETLNKTLEVFNSHVPKE